jgi:hypothetical protein
LSERTPEEDRLRFKTQTVKSGYEPQTGLVTKTNWLTD